MTDALAWLGGGSALAGKAVALWFLAVCCVGAVALALKGDRT